MHYLSLLSTLITFVFTYAVFARYRQRGGAHLFLWGIGLVLYGLGTFSEIILGFTFNAWVLKLWYLTGAMLTAPWLGQGTINLLVRKARITRAANVVLLLVSLLSLVLVVLLPVNADAAALYNPALPASSSNPAFGNLLNSRGEPLAQYQAIIQTKGLVLILTILLNTYGTLALVGGAIYSSYIFWRKKVLANRMIGNVLIAAGGLMPAMGGTFVRAGMADWLYVSEFIGVILMFIGFIQATAAQPARQAEPSVAD